MPAACSHNLLFFNGGALQLIIFAITLKLTKYLKLLVTQYDTPF